MSISFLRPELAAALLLIPLLWFFPRRLREVPLGLLRSLVILLIVLALMRPVTVSEQAEEHHVVIFDQSTSTAASASDSTLKMLSAALDELPKSSKHKLLWIGAADAMPEAIIKHFDERVVMSTGGGGSPLSAALTLAARSIPDGTPGAVTLISDGLATDTRWGSTAQALAARGVPVHTVALPRPQGDLRPVAFGSPEPLRVGRLARLMVEVVGGRADLRVTLRGPSGALATTETHRCFGRVRVPVEFEPQQSGFLALTAEVEIVNGGDTRPGNNSLSRTFPVQDPLRVLYVGGRMAGASKQLRSMVGHGFEFDENSNLGAVSRTDLRRYDLVMLDDSPAARIPEQFQSRLARTVEDNGLGLLMSGGSAAFGPGGYHKSPLENLLPVEFVQKEEKKDPSTSLAIIIDTSGSMGGNRIILAKEVTRLAIRRLLPHDKVGIV